MWTSYTKIFCFRDCFQENKVIGDVKEINKLLAIEQKGDEHGAFITTDILSTGNADNITANQDDEDGTWYLEFYYGEKHVASVSLWDYKEVQLCFEIEKDLDTDELIIHYCKIKAFKDYQI